MDDIVYFETLEEAKKEYPPIIFEYYNEKVRNFYVSETDLAYYRKNYDRVEIEDEFFCMCYRKVRRATEVGYLFLKGKWYPVYETWDGWQYFFKDDKTKDLNV